MKKNGSRLFNAYQCILKNKPKEMSGNRSYNFFSFFFLFSSHHLKIPQILYIVVVSMFCHIE